MPVTPFHLGPALVAKALCPPWFSLGVFMVVQIAIDLETAWNILAGNPTLHGPLHTLPGSLLLAVVVVPPAKYGLSHLYAIARRRGVTLAGAPGWSVAELNPIPWTAAITSGFLGSVSHVLLDAVIHWDVMPWAPLSDANPLYLPGSFMWVHLLCGVLAGCGLLLWLGLRRESASPERRGQSVTEEP